MKLKSIYLILGILFLFISCNKKHETETEIENKFVKTWYDTEYIIPGRSKLIIKKDSTFNYTSAGCDWRSFSKGKWKMSGDFIELTSTKVDTCYVVFPFLDCGFFDRKNKERLLTIPNCEPKGNSDFCFFNKEKFYLKNDSLVCKIKPESKCPDTLKIVFAKTPKIPKHYN
ncbi:hypothetical protein [Flavobacterium hungaricum]|uniref:Lipoprotein n=1 Tax=Flavobacterium hungaricum TaxID=2082725 RepID=A0ABR9TUL6_9FLAO|nr:hypothetical protein [Flavobacterium hungaricum]MBE8728332.1 hypothetical protein [Flavobacterium hungaricum]